MEYKIKNVNRDVGTKVSGELAYRWRTSVLDWHVAELRFEGSAGQSFGAFCVGGLKLVLEGEANDYVLSRMLGLNDEEIQRLKDAGTVGDTLADAQTPSIVPLERQVELGWISGYDEL